MEHGRLLGKKRAKEDHVRQLEVGTGLAVDVAHSPAGMEVEEELSQDDSREVELNVAASTAAPAERSCSEEAESRPNTKSHCSTKPLQ